MFLFEKLGKTFENFDLTPKVSLNGTTLYTGGPANETVVISLHIPTSALRVAP